MSPKAIVTHFSSSLIVGLFITVPPFPSMTREREANNHKESPLRRRAAEIVTESRVSDLDQCLRSVTKRFSLEICPAISRPTTCVSLPGMVTGPWSGETMRDTVPSLAVERQVTIDSPPLESRTPRTKSSRPGPAVLPTQYMPGVAGAAQIHAESGNAPKFRLMERREAPPNSPAADIMQVKHLQSPNDGISATRRREPRFTL
jgi:hypothetical protein